MALLGDAVTVPLLSMNMLLFLLLVVAGEAAYISTTIQQQSASGFQEQEAAWQAQDSSLRAEAKQLVNAKEELQRAMTSTQATIADITAQLHGQKPAETAPSPGTTSGQAPTTSAPSADLVAPPTTSLGAISTTDGKKYENCQLLKIEPDGITFSHADGITKVLFTNLPTEMQVRFEFDPATGTASQAAQTRYQNLIDQGGTASSAAH